MPCRDGVLEQGGEAGAHGFHAVGLVGGEIRFLAGIGGKVVEVDDFCCLWGGLLFAASRSTLMPSISILTETTHRRDGIVSDYQFAIAA